MYDICIIGAGFAGLTAAIYAKRAGKNITVYDKMGYGGQIINASKVENYPSKPSISGFDLATDLYNHAQSLGISIEMSEILSVCPKTGENTGFDLQTKEGQISAKKLIIATGASHKEAGIKGEDKYKGAGVSYCATCDGALFKGRIVAVIGGGNTALYNALYLSEICSKVYILHRREEYRAEKHVIDSAKAKGNIVFISNVSIDEIAGSDTVEKIVYHFNREDSAPQCIDTDGVFISVGNSPNTEIFSNLVNTDGNGYIIASEDCKTSHSGIYVAGDCRTKPVRQLTTAVADGTVAAMSCIDALNN